MVSVALLGAYTLFDMAVFFPTSGQRILYAAATLPLFAGVALFLRRIELSRQGWLIACAFAAVGLLPLAATLTQADPIPHYILGDLAMMLLPAAAFVLGAAVPELYRSRASLGLLIAILAIASLAAPILGRAQTGRFISPPLLLIAFSWVLALRPSSARIRSLGWSLVLGCAVLVILSATRSTMVLYCAIGVGASMLISGPIRGLIYGGIGVAIFSAIASSIPPDLLDSVVRAIRVEELSEGVADQSVQTRIDEVVDVFANISAHWGPGNWLLGSGHGATWEIFEASPNPNNVLADGRVHQIHCTPALLLWHAGLLGLLGFAAITLYSLRQAGTQGWTRLHPAAMVFRLAAVAYLVDSGVRVVMADPIFSFSLAGMLYWSEVARDQEPEGGPCRTMTPSSI